MYKSLDLKTNNLILHHYLLNNLLNINLDNVYISEHQFKNYYNIIIHFLGNNYSYFYKKTSQILAEAIIYFYEPKIIKNIIDKNYFYFNSTETKQIFNICLSDLEAQSSITLLNRKNLIIESINNYISECKKLIIDGFVNFRLKNYTEILNNTVDNSVSSFLVQKEYLEFIDLLKIYISSKEFNNSKIHIIYNNKESILLNEDLNIINNTNSILNAKYLSDITFSSNDYALNALLSLLPNEIYIHTCNTDDDFINTLKLIFGEHLFICSDCSICDIYKQNKIPII